MNNNNNRRISNKILLRHGNIRKYWNDMDSEILAPILYEMDSKENWVVNKDSSVLYAINDFAKILSLNDMDEKKFHENLEQFILLLAYINSSWSFRILKWLEENRNAILMKITIVCSMDVSNLMNDEEDVFLTPSQLFIDRMIAIKNLGLISKIFSDNRVRIINSSLKNLEEREFEDG